MNQIAVILSLLVLHISLSMETEATEVLYVTPGANDSCPGKPCLTFTQYSQHYEVYFRAAAELFFLPGYHILSENFTIKGNANFSMLTFTGELHQSRIHFREGVALALIGIENVTIESLSFHVNTNFNIRESKTLYILNLQLGGSDYTLETIENVSATNITVSNISDASQILIIRFSQVVFTTFNVVNNTGESIISVDQSTVQFMNTIVKNNIALINSSLMISASVAVFEGYTQFYMNRCEGKGGAVIIIDSTVTFTDQLELRNNTANYSGGALTSSYSSLIFFGFINVVSNSVLRPLRPQFGGSIDSFYSNITINGTATFRNNYIHGIAMCLGGAIGARMSTLVFSGAIEFHGNYVDCLISHGGALSLVNSELIAVEINFTFTYNVALTGGAIALIGVEINYNEYTNNTVHIHGASLFELNEAQTYGGGVYGEGTFHMSFSGYTTLTLNIGPIYGSDITLAQGSKSQLLFNGQTEIKHGYSSNGPVHVSDDVEVIFNGTTAIINNTVLNRNGVLSALFDASYTFIGQTIFQGNKGGVLALKQSNSLIFNGVATFHENDVGITLTDSTVKLEGDLIFTHNSERCINILHSNVTINGTMSMKFNAADSGPAIVTHSSTVYMFGSNTFYGNRARDDGGSIYVISSEFYLHGRNSFTSNVAQRGGTIYAVNSNVYLSGNQTFTYNNANSGGVITLGVYAVVHFNNLHMSFISNMADKGAIIYVEDILNSIDCSNDSESPVPDAISVRPQCFFVKNDNVSVTQSDNVASDKGDILFGGNLKRCNNVYAFYDFQRLFKFDETVQNVSSNPYNIVFCNGSDQYLSTLPGKLFFQPVAAVVRAEFPVELNYTTRLGQFQSKQTVNGFCTPLYYRIYTQASSVTLMLYADGPCSKTGTASISLLASLGNCPDGFQIANDECICTSDLLKYTSVCNIDNESILNSGDFWAGGLYNNGSYVGVISFPHCPFDYCKQNATFFTLKDPDPQCAKNRSATMCGGCKLNHSLTLGGAGCALCPPNPLIIFALILLFATLGIVLVALLICLRLTVVLGTLNGLIFYANIVGSNKDIFKIQGWMNVFISWLNLDFGFAVCFYDGMDTYTHTWMQFFFPFYIWMLIGIIIVISHHSTWMTRRLGSNPVAVLATLILLSYAKLLRTIITVFYYANLELPHGVTTKVWLFDGNIAYLHGKHLPLFMFALIFFILAFVPYNMLLLLGPWLQRVPAEKYNESHYKALVRKLLVGWYNDYRIQSFMEAYLAPYNSGYHYWTGTFLMLRCVLFLVFASNALGESSTNLLAIASITLGIVIFTRLINGRIYKSWWIDLLEALFLLNLGILSVGTFHTMSIGGDQQILANLSVGISFTLFLIILLFHALKQVMITSLYKTITTRLKSKLQRGITRDLENSQQQIPLVTSSSLSETDELQSAVAPTVTYVSLSPHSSTQD